MVGLGRRGWLGVLPGAGQSVLFLTASLLVAPEPLGEARRGTVVRPDYGRRGFARFMGEGLWSIGARRRRVANLREGPLRLDLHLKVRLHSSSLRGVARRRARSSETSQQQQGALPADETGR
ncbi:hypothetical protein Taro_047300 [Colocasia esculenta]|uniref:Secreted protein n=1 Tax=Colocasia esculenta TaxID=4460 RepID=A0A843X7V9_COLES|nr:hypothetical protein [Colocasia esculenta]